jgi:hypothetical protein
MLVQHTRWATADSLYAETVILTALGVGGYHSPHADNCRQNEQGDWVANHTAQRDATGTAIYYLNDEFDVDGADGQWAQMTKGTAENVSGSIPFRLRQPVRARIAGSARNVPRPGHQPLGACRQPREVREMGPV